MPRTVNDLMRRSLRLCGVLAGAETLDATDSADSLLALNQMLDAWAADRLFVYSIVERSHPMVAGTASYTIGSGGTINVARPPKIEYAFSRDSQNIDRNIQIIPDDEFALITLKSQPNTFPTALKYQAAYPLGIVTVFPPPLLSLTLFLGVWTPLTEFAAATDSVALPPGYEEAIVYSLAERLSGEYGTRLTPEQMKIAAEARAKVYGNNLPEVRQHCEFTGAGGRLLTYADYVSGNF